MTGLRWRIGLVGALVLWFCFLTVANFVPKEQRVKSPLLPDDGIRLGLDLQGGIHWVLGVKLEEAEHQELDFLRQNLEEQGYNLDKIPYVVQYNKRDLPNAAPLDELRKICNPTNVPDFEAVGTTGVGVFDTLKAVAKLVLTELKRGG